MELVFGYGSLAWDGHSRVHEAELSGARRVWGVAMDNTVDLPGYKHYLRRDDGSRPAVCVAFLDLEPWSDSAVNGICLEVTPTGLAELDERERQYVREDVTDRLMPRPPGRAWTYVGRPESRERLRRAVSSSRAVVSREYLDRVLGGFEALGGLERFRASTELDGLPVLDLVRIDPPAAAPSCPGGLYDPPGRILPRALGPDPSMPPFRAT